MRPTKWLIRGVALAVLLALTPIRIDPVQGVQEKTVCSKEHPGCMPEIDSLCTAGEKPVMNYYNRSS